MLDRRASAPRGRRQAAFSRPARRGRAFPARRRSCSAFGPRFAVKVCRALPHIAVLSPLSSVLSPLSSCLSLFTLFSLLPFSPFQDAIAAPLRVLRAPLSPGGSSAFAPRAGASCPVAAKPLAAPAYAPATGASRAPGRSSAAVPPRLDKTLPPPLGRPPRPRSGPRASPRRTFSSPRVPPRVLHPTSSAPLGLTSSKTTAGPEWASRPAPWARRLRPRGGRSGPPRQHAA